MIVNFRGEEKEIIIETNEIEYDTNSHTIEWSFKGLTTEQHDNLNITDQEYENICDQIAQGDE